MTPLQGLLVVFVAVVAASAGLLIGLNCRCTSSYSRGWRMGHRMGLHVGRAAANAAWKARLTTATSAHIDGRLAAIQHEQPGGTS